MPKEEESNPCCCRAHAKRIEGKDSRFAKYVCEVCGLMFYSFESPDAGDASDAEE